MIASQRRTHVWLWLLLGPVMIAAAVSAVVLRPDEPVYEGAAPGSDRETQPGEVRLDDVKTDEGGGYE